MGRLIPLVLFTQYLYTVKCENRILSPACHWWDEVFNQMSCCTRKSKCKSRTLPQQVTHSPVQVPSRLKWLSGHWERQRPDSSTWAGLQTVQLRGLFPAHWRQDGSQAEKKTRRVIRIILHGTVVAPLESTLSVHLDFPIPGHMVYTFL